MSKDKISDYSATANSNTDIAGINIDEGCAPSGINNAIRTLMKQLKDWQSGSQDVYITPAGSAAAPAVTTTGDTNTGILFPAADTVAVSTGGTERVRIDSSGNLGLGVTPSASWNTTFASSTICFKNSGVINGSLTGNGLRIGTNWYYSAGGSDTYLTTAAASRFDINGNTFAWQQATSGTAGNTITFTQAMTLDASGYLGIGTTSPGQKLDLAGGSMTLSASTGTQQIYLYRFSATNYSSIGTDSSAGGITFTTGTSSPTERMRIDSSGNLLVGTTSADARLTAYGTTSDSTAYTVAFKNSTGGLSLLVRNDGYVRSSTTYSNTNAAAANVYIDSGGYLYRSTSSLKYKTDVSNAEHGLAELLKLRSVTYKQKTPNADGSEQKQIFGGLIAEEVHETGLTEFVQYADDGTPDALAYGQMVSLCIKAIQEQQALIQQLTQRIETLESK